MADIFNRDASQLAGVFTADRVKVFFSNFTAAMAQSVQVQYRQNVSRIYELGTTNMYFVGGRTEGTANINRIIGPSNTITNFYQTYGDVCGAKGRNIEFRFQETDCSTGAARAVALASAMSTAAGAGLRIAAESAGGISYILQNNVLTSATIGLTAENMIINEASGLVFTALEVK